MDVNCEPSSVYGKPVAKLVHHFLEEMVNGLDRLVVAAVKPATVPHCRAYRTVHYRAKTCYWNGFIIWFLFCFIDLAY